ncbi:MAG TPA: hypothetical protein VIJ15_05935, partial [Dermatophilaceae bacterium]
ASETGLVIAGSRIGDADRTYTWQGTVTPVPGTSWFHLRIVLDSDGFRIGDHRSVEPQIAVNLGGLPPYERGDHVWFKTLVENPTQWNGEGGGNDFPALSYYDPYLRTQFRMFFDMTPMSWMSKDTIARFYGYSCAFRRLYDGEPSAEIGLLAHAQSGNDFPAGPQVFSWYLSAEHLEGEPTPPAEQDVLQDLVESCLPLLRSSTAYWPEHATRWADFAAGCAVDLMSTEHSWGSDESGEYLLSYVDSRSDAWEKTMAARGEVHGGSEPCLESALWALRPIDVLQSAFPDGPYAQLQARLERFVREEARRDRCLVLSGLAVAPTPMGSWQYVYILAELWFLYAERDDDDLLARIREEIDTVTIPLAQQTQYLFPLQFDKQSLRKIGPGSAYAVCGTYGLLMADLAAKTGESRYLDEARRALRTLANVPIDAALQEVVLIAHAIDAADRLHELTGEPEWDEARKYFRAQTLRMMYWYDDETSPRTAQASQLGMFNACANINYPAFFENIEADARLAAAALAEDDPAATLQILDYGRRNNFSFFPRCSPDMYGPMPLDFIPFEDVPMLEGPNDAGFLGQEIYGAGFTFRAHLLWDAFASAADREVMVLSVDSYREGPTSATTWEGTFLLFNSRDEPVDTVISFPIIRGGDEGKVTWQSPEGRASTHLIAGGKTLPVNLEPRGWARMSVAVVRALT